MALILIVDDSPTEMHVMQTALERHGYRTAAAADGAEGIRLAREMSPDLIFMDIVMPGMNGYQATRALANDPKTRSIPIIMVTSKGQQTDRIWGLRQGAVDYMVKPVSPDQLVAKAHATLERRGRAVSAQVSHDGAVGREWVGVALRIAGELYLVAREETREVSSVPPSLTRVPGAKNWVKGLANVRGHLLAIIDLRQFLGGSATVLTRN